MGQFLYFLPGSVQDLPRALSDRGLLGRFRHRPARNGSPAEIGEHARKEIGCGPDGGRGMLIGTVTDGLVYAPDSQRWRGPFSVERDSRRLEYWIGFDPGSPPGPDDLERERQIEGTEVELLDGNLWRFPASRWAPRRIEVEPGGELKVTPLPAAEMLCERARQMIVWLDEKKPIPWQFEIELAAEGLAANYRIGSNPAEELSLLGLISTENVIEINRALLDLDAFKRETEKKTPTVC